MQNDTPSLEELTDDEKLLMSAVRHLPDDQVAMMRIRFEGRPAAAIVAVNNEPDENGEIELRPLCLLMDGDILDRVADSENNALQPLEPVDRPDSE